MIENNNEPTPRAPSQNGISEEGGGNSRRNSASSQLSSSTTSPNYDSGNLSDLSLCLHPGSLEDEDYGQHSKFQHLLREKDQSLFLALQDVRRLKSELERISKSEKWYKSELKTQKNLRMEILEKLYTNERKFTQENQRLQNEVVSLYARCSEIEQQLQEEKDAAKELLKNASRSEAVSDGTLLRDFEMEQHRQRIADQEQLIDMLRNQKRGLLKDLQKLSCEKDEVVLQLQKSLAQLEDENRTITKRCLQLVEVKNVLKEKLSAKEAECSGRSNEVLDLQIVVKDLQGKLYSHIADFNQKEQEVNSLKHELSQKQDSDKSAELLQSKYLQELSKKEQSICSLNEVIKSMKEQITSLEAAHTRNDEQQREIDELKELLKERTSEMEILRRIDERSLNQSEDQSSDETNHKIPEPSLPMLETTSLLTCSSLEKQNEALYQQNLDLQSELDSLKSKYATTSQTLEVDNLRKTKQELEQLSKKYLEVCKLYEKSKFESDMKDITVEKFKFEKENDSREIGTLREKLGEVSKKFENQKSLATEFELMLSRVKQENSRLEFENKCNNEQNLKLKVEANQSVRVSNEKDIEMESLRAQLFEAHDRLNNQKEVLNSEAAIILKKACESRAALVDRLSALQMGKVNQLNEELLEWEGLFATIKREEDPTEVDGNSTEFDDLNQLFADQNLELMHLNETYHRQSFNLRESLEKTEEENKTFQQELETAKHRIIDLERQVETLERANADYEKEIAHLAGANQRLIEEFNEDFSRERETHKKQTKQLKVEAELRNTECDSLRGELQDLQSEVDRLKSFESCDSDRQSDDSVSDRILQNVLETEHRRKMSRYDIHIRSLLSSIKSYKKSLEVAENRYDALLVKSKEMVDGDELRAMEINVENIRIQFEDSQREVKNLKHQLKTLTEFCVTDASKSTNTMDLTNLMDDYKKLIQQSQTATKRPSTSEIYDLINKSNNFVPNLTNVSTSIDGLREDVQQMCTAISQSSFPAGRGSPHPKMSLMDELKLAENGKLF